MKPYTEVAGEDSKKPLCFGSGLLGVMGGGEAIHEAEEERMNGIRGLEWKRFGVEIMEV